MIVGIIGGGQLGMMLAEAIISLGHKAIALDPNKKCSASHVCQTLVYDYNDLEGLKELAKLCDVITYEFENVNALGLDYLESKGLIKQGIKQLYDSQNRIREKNNAKAYGLNTPKYKRVTNYEELIDSINEIGLPAVYKTTTLGYDGHGQVVIKNMEDVDKVKPYLGGEGILEEFIKYDFETSIIMVRDKNNIISFPMGINIHKRGILDLVVVKDNIIKEELKNKIEKDCKNFMINTGYEGILCIELFIKGDNYYFNEMAPRPHNSGHYTIEGTTTSQYLELANYLIGNKLNEPILKYPTIMKNILGFDYENMKKFKNDENIHIHDYYKTEVRENRKMAHITFTNLEKDEYDMKYKNEFVGE